MLPASTWTNSFVSRDQYDCPGVHTQMPDSAPVASSFQTVAPDVAISGPVASARGPQSSRSVLEAASPKVNVVIRKSFLGTGERLDRGRDGSGPPHRSDRARATTHLGRRRH